MSCSQTPSTVIPAKAGIQVRQGLIDPGSSPRFRGGTAGMTILMSVPDFFRTPVSLDCQRHRRKRADGRRVGAFGDFDECRRGARTLAQPRCAMVAGQSIGVAVGAGRLVLVFRGVVPGAAGEPNDAGAHGLGHAYADEAGPARVKNAHDFTIADAAAPGIDGIDRQCLAPAILPLALTAAHPTGCAGGGPAGWRQGAAKRSRLPAAKPFRGFDPSRMRRAAIIGEPGNLLGIQLDPPGGSAQRVTFGIGAGLSAQYRNDTRRAK
jgi:hypothetical protein